MAERIMSEGFFEESRRAHFKIRENKKRRGIYVKLLERDGRKSFAYTMMQEGTSFLIKKLWGNQFRVIGEDNVPKCGSAILAANHESHIDPPFVAIAIRRPIHFIARLDEGFSPLWARFFYNLAGVIRVSAAFAADGGKHSVRQIRNVVDLGELIGVFPEGPLEHKRDRRTVEMFKPGVVSIARRYGLAVIPICIYGTDDVQPNSKARLIQPIRIRPVTVTIGEPMAADVLKSAEQVRKAIIELQQKAVHS